MKQPLIFITLLALLASSVILAGPAQAETQTRIIHFKGSGETSTTSVTKAPTRVSADPKMNANREIDRRIVAMTALIARVNKIERITSDQKASLVAQLQTAINDLTALKAKIAADTDAATLRADKEAIISLYRVFTFLMPKVEIMAHANMILQTISEANATTTTFQAKWQASGKDLSTLQPFLTDRQAKLTNATTQAQNAIAKVSSLDVADYPSNKTSLESARAMLKASRDDLRLAHQDLVKANQAFKALK